MTLDELRTATGGHVGIFDVACPKCGPERKSSANRNRRVLRIWDDGDFVTFKCARCEQKGWAKDHAAGISRPVRSEKPSPAVQPDKAVLAAYLWMRSVEADGTPVESYLRKRGCWVPSPLIRYLPPTDQHPPTMIARFDVGVVKGVHLTRLTLDGDKAGTETDKMTLGPSMGQPIMVHNNHERGELVITEGIEDAATIALATGWSAWAAGTAGRIAPLVATVTGYDRIYVAVDDDRAGRRALARARALVPVIPLLFGRIAKGADANSILLRYGVETLHAAIQFCEAQELLRRGDITLNMMQRAGDRLNALLPDST